MRYQPYCDFPTYPIDAFKHVGDRKIKLYDPITAIVTAAADFFAADATVATIATVADTAVVDGAVSVGAAAVDAGLGATSVAAEGGMTAAAAVSDAPMLGGMTGSELAGDASSSLISPEVGAAQSAGASAGTGLTSADAATGTGALSPTLNPASPDFMGPQAPTPLQSMQNAYQNFTSNPLVQGAKMAQQGLQVANAATRLLGPSQPTNGGQPAAAPAAQPAAAAPSTQTAGGITQGNLLAAAPVYDAATTAQMAKLRQLYPQLSQVSDRILAPMVQTAPTSASVVSGVSQPAIQAPLQSFAKGGHAEHKPEFITGETGHYVQGKGDGQSDDIPAMLADGEYVFDADTVAALGNGSSNAGAKRLDEMREAIRKHKRAAPVDKIPPKAKSPLQYLKG